MKKKILTSYLKLAFALLISSSGFAQQGNQKTTSNPAVKNAPTECDYFVSEEDGKKMIEKFEIDFRKKGSPDEVKGLNLEYWLPSCVISSLFNFFNRDENKYFDGVRFYWIVKQSAAQDEENRTSLVIVPTSPVDPPSASFKHTDRWDLTIRDECGSSEYLNMRRTDAERLRKAYGEDFRQTRTIGDVVVGADNDQLSAAYWMDTCVIAALQKVLLQNSTLVDGIIAYNAVYFTKDDISRPYRLYDYQSTLVFVPGKKTGDVLKPDWELLNKFRPKSYDIKAAANHGHLCPQVCD
ncbi:MAG: hypothetical protein NTZ41_02895 [Sphingobacteriales bacterium]|nr:hypothetical protein [Sphingobacteriales bacterium]